MAQTQMALQATGGFVITPADTGSISTDAGNTRKYAHCAIYVGGAGNLRVVMADGSDITFIGLLAGTFLPIQAVKVFANSTSCTNLIGLIAQQ